MKGIVNNLKMEGIGEVLWSVVDVKGTLTAPRLPAHCIPKPRQRLPGISSFTQTHPDSTITVTADAWTISKNGQSIDVHVDPRNNLPIAICF